MYTKGVLTFIVHGNEQRNRFLVITSPVLQNVQYRRIMNKRHNRATQIHRTAMTREDKIPIHLRAGMMALHQVTIYYAKGWVRILYLSTSTMFRFTSIKNPIYSDIIFPSFLLKNNNNDARRNLNVCLHFCLLLCLLLSLLLWLKSKYKSVPTLDPFAALYSVATAPQLQSYNFIWQRHLILIPYH